MKIFSEEAVRAFFRCPQFWGFGGLVYENTSNHLLKVTLEGFFRSWMEAGYMDKKVWNDFLILNTKTIRTLAKQEDLSPLGERFIFAMGKWLVDLVNQYPFETSELIMGPGVLKLKLAENVILCGHLGLIRTLDGTYHLLSSTPYNNQRDATCDPILVLMAGYLETAKEQLGLPREAPLKVHLYRLMDFMEPLQEWTILEGEVSDSYFRGIVGTLKRMEEEAFAPLIPCPDKNCQFRSRCNNFVELKAPSGELMVPRSKAIRSKREHFERDRFRDPE